MINLSVGYFHACLLAVHDLIHKDATLAEVFGAVALSGLVTVAPGSAAVTGTGDFAAELTAGDRITIDDQVGYVESIEGPAALTLAAPHVAGGAAVTAYRSALVFISDFPVAPPIGPPFCIVSGGPIAAVEPGVGERHMEPTVWVHYVAEIPQRPLTDAAPNLWDVGDRLARVLSDPGVPAVTPPAHLLCVPRFGNAQLANGLTAAAQGISELQVEGTDPARFVGAPGWAFTYRSISNPLDVMTTSPPLW